MSESADVTCPRCSHPLGEGLPERGIGALDHLCPECRAVLRVRFFRGEIVDAEERFPGARGRGRGRR